MPRLPKAIVAAGIAAAILSCSAALAGPPGSTVLLTRPAGFGALTPPSVNDSVSSSVSLHSTPGNGSHPGRRLVGGPSNTTRYVVFVSGADGMSPDDDDRFENVFVRDLQTNTTTLVSRGSNGTPANADAEAPAISADGSTVAFTSAATNLVPNADTNGTTQVYKRNLITNSTTLVSRATNAAGAIADSSAGEPSVSGDGSAVAFSSTATNLGGGSAGFYQVYVRDGTTTTLASVPNLSSTPGNEASYGPSLSDDGNYVAFTTEATNIGVSDVNNRTDVFRHKLSSNETSLASVRTIAPAGQLGDSDSSGASISADGTRVAFVSSARNFSTLDAAPAFSDDVYVHDFSTPATFLVSQNNSSVKSNGPAEDASISANGQRVAFLTDATNMNALDTNGLRDVYVRDTVSPGTTFASRCQGGALLTQHAFEAAISPGGTRVSFTTASRGCAADQDDDFGQVFLRTTQLSLVEPTTWISRPTGTAPFRSGTSGSAIHGFFRSDDAPSALNADGSIAAFASESDEMSAEDDNSFANVFARDARTGATELISRASGAAGAAANGPSGPGLHNLGGLSGSGSSPPAISDDGRFIAFASTGDNLVPGDANGQTDVFVRDRIAQTTTRVSVKTGGSEAIGDSYDPDLSADGGRIAFTSDARLDPVADPDTDPDIYVRDVATGVTTLASVNGAEDQANDSSSDPSISGDGNRIAFVTRATNLWPFDANVYADVYVRDLSDGSTRLASARNGMAMPGDLGAGHADLDFTGAHVAFSSAASNLVGADVNGAFDVFVRELDTATTTLVSRGLGGQSGNAHSGRPSMSADGTRIAFETSATDLFADDTDGLGDVVVRDLTAATTTLASRADGAAGALPNATTGNPSISADGHCVAFDSFADNLVAGPAGTDFVRAYLRALDADCGVAAAAPAPAPGPAPGPGPGPGATADTVAPAISGLKLSPATFRVGAKPTAVSARKLPPKGTKIKFTLSEAAAVSLRIERKASGRKKGRKCLAKRTTGKRCTRYVLKGTLKRAGKAGANSVAFSGRIGSKKLAKGRYRVRATATDAAGNKSAKKAAVFRIV